MARKNARTRQARRTKTRILKAAKVAGRRKASKRSKAITRPPARRTVRRRPKVQQPILAQEAVAVPPSAQPIFRVTPPQESRSLQPGPREAAQPVRKDWAREEGFTIPMGYGDHRIVLMVKDPWWLFAYWEIQSDRERQVRSQLAPEETEGLRSVLRVYDVTNRNFPTQSANHGFDIPLSGLATNWYIHVDAPNRSFIVDIGLLTKRGRFLTLARSNQVSTPRFGPSEVIDEEWMIQEEDYWKLFGVTAGIGMGSSPVGLKELLERKLFSPGLFSPGLFSPVKVPKAKGWRLWVDTELIVYGATASKATVTIQGQPVKLRPDGTFSMRMALPDGTQTIPVSAVSPDKQETKTITPIVTRKTEGQVLDQRQETRDRRPETTAQEM